MVAMNVDQDTQTYNIICAAMAVHRELGCGFLEAVFQEAFEFELAAQEIPHRREVHLPVFYRGQQLHTHYQVDFICYDSILVALKALKHLGSIEEAQVLNSLKASKLERALLLNFGTPSLEHKRFVYSH
ncbi:MAG: GxxExxY protein [Verrucomicrobiales bacterium]|jgi:GxxExxY protein